MAIAVLTGDIIRSTALIGTGLEQAFTALGEAAAEVGRWQGQSAHFTRSRGDGWQLCLARPEFALRAALCLRAALRASGSAAETRIAIATGAGSAESPDDLNAATGPAFTASGRALDSLDSAATMVHADGGAIAAAVRLADHISQGWTQAQARSLALMLAPDPPTRARAGAALGISRQAVDQALSSAGYAALGDAMEMLEANASENAFFSKMQAK